MSRSLDAHARHRRALLQVGLAGAAASSPWTRALAQSGEGRLQRLPKQALVIGNSAYKSAPELQNPRNDARAIAANLQALGFEVVNALDADRAGMRAALDTYVAALARRKSVGLFYFAGHGLQLDWKNYLLPVDARITGAADVQAQAVELNALMAGLTRAANPMNIVLLDACRDNPFGSELKTGQKGLSQMDAPVGTILGYATAPGNVASDGDGQNGLYTGNLLREMKVQYARIEDVFKRVRLAVRRASNGAQIPWESTSLEDDYYFIPPPELVRVSEEEKKKQFDVELKIWESIESASSPKPFEEYLQRFPSGIFAELAQLQFDRALAREGEKPVEVVPEAGNPYTAGSLRADTAYKVGDSYSYRIFDRETGAQRRLVTNTVTQITDREVIYNKGRSATDLLGNVTRFSDGRKSTSSQVLPLEYAVGRQWTTRYVSTAPNGTTQFNVEFNFRITGKEKVSVAAGTFDCFRVEGRGRAFAVFGQFQVEAINNYWMAPQSCRASIKREVMRKIYRRGTPEVLENERFELDSFHQG